LTLETCRVVYINIENKNLSQVASVGLLIGISKNFNLQHIQFAAKGDFGSNVKGDLGNNVKGDFGNNVKGDFGNNVKKDFGNNIKGDFHNNVKGDFGNNVKSLKCY
jgi:hypothetical protein